MKVSNFRELINFYLVVWRRGRKLAVVTTIGCCAIAGIYLAVTPKQYAATAQLVVSQPGGRPINLTGVGESTPQPDATLDYISTQLLVVGSPKVVGNAVTAVGLNRLPTLAAVQRSGRDPIEAAISQLTVDRVSRTAKVIRLTYWARSRAEATTTVAAIIKSYSEYLELSARQQNAEAGRLLEQAYQASNLELENCRKQYHDFRIQHPSLMVDDRGKSPIAARIEQLQRQLSDAVVKEIQLRAQLELGKTLASKGVGLWAITRALEQAGSAQVNNQSPGTAPVTPVTSQEYLAQLGQELQRMTEQFGPENARVKSLREQIRRVQVESNSTRQRIEHGAVTDLLASIEESLKTQSKMRVAFQTAIDTDTKECKDIEDSLLVETNLRERVTRQQAQLDMIRDQLKQVQMSKSYSGICAQSVESPHSGLKAVKPNVTMVGIIAVVSGLVLGFGTIIVIEYSKSQLDDQDLDMVGTGVNIVMYRNGQINSAPDEVVRRSANVVPPGDTTTLLKPVKSSISAPGLSTNNSPL